jgi:hypothetical protein
VGAQSPVEEKACATAAPVVAASPTASTSAPAAVDFTRRNTDRLLKQLHSLGYYATLEKIA